MRSAVVGFPLALAVVVVAMAAPVANAGGTRGGGAPQHRVSTTFDDINGGSWAAAAIEYVAREHAWMRDYGPNVFRPERTESRAQFARALARAFAKGDTAEGGPSFTDLPESDQRYPSVALVVERGWMTTTAGAFRPDEPVTTVEVHAGLLRALRLRRELRGLDRIATIDGISLEHARGFAPIVLGMVLGFRLDHDRDELDVRPKTELSRAEVAYSLWRAHQALTISRWKLRDAAAYRGITLGRLGPRLRAMAEFGFDSVGQPYVWSGEWPKATPPGYCCGAQAVGGFDCSGIVWWAMRNAEGGYDAASLRGFSGWSLPERSSRDMASVGPRLSYEETQPGDLLFFDGTGDGVVDHVSISLGRGWALDASDSYGGVAVIRVGEGWYRERFTHGRAVI